MVVLCYSSCTGHLSRVLFSFTLTNLDHDFYELNLEMKAGQKVLKDVNTRVKMLKRLRQGMIDRCDDICAGIVFGVAFKLSGLSFPPFQPNLPPSHPQRPRKRRGGVPPRGY